jgi:hypothetical protein
MRLVPCVSTSGSQQGGLRVVGYRTLAAAAVALAVMASLAAPAAAQSPAPSGVVFEGSGPGGMTTVPFALQAGDHRLAYTVAVPTGSAGCGMGFSLRAMDGSYLGAIGSNGATVGPDTPHAGETWFLVPTAGDFVLDVTGDCDWEGSLVAATSPFDAGVPVVITGVGPLSSPSFTLGAGDHRLHYRATNPSTTEACIFFGPGVIRPGPYAESMGDPIDQVVDAGATLEGDLLVYGLSEGRYQLMVNYAWCSPGLSESIAWEIVVDPS